MSSRPPPIPRRAVAQNILRAREQIANEKNRARANAMVEKARENQARRRLNIDTDKVERMFQSRNELDAITQIEQRNRARQEQAQFQERQAKNRELQENLRQARQIGEDRRRIAKIRGEIKQKLSSADLTSAINKESVAGRKLAGRETKDFANALFGGIGLQQVATKIDADKRIKHTRVKPIPEPEPEPEPEPQPEPEPAPITRDEVDFRGNVISGGVKGRPQAEKVVGARVGGGFKLATPPRPFGEPQPEPERVFGYESAGGSNFGTFASRQ
jgi:hypothetical protein